VNRAQRKLDKLVRRQGWFTVVHIMGKDCDPAVAAVETKGYDQVYFL